MGQCARNRHRRHRTTHDKRRNDRGLVVLCEHFQSTHHDTVECHRAVDVNERGHHGVVLHELLTKEDATHINRILRTGRLCHRPHERLIRQGHVREQHIQVTLVHRHIRRLANRTTRMVQPLGHIAKLHELLKIGHCCITTATLGITHKWRAVDWRQNKVLATNHNVPFRVAGMLGKRRRGSCAQLACKPTRNTHPLALNLSTSSTPTLKRLRAIDKVHANFGQNCFGIALDDLQRGLVQNFIVRNVTLDIFCCLYADGCTLCTTGSTTATTRATTRIFLCLRHTTSPNINCLGLSYDETVPRLAKLTPLRAQKRHCTLLHTCPVPV